MATAMTKSRGGTVPAVESGNAEPMRPVFMPRADIVETKDHLLLLADMPGIAADGIDITIENRVLTIRGHAASQEHRGYERLYQEYGEGDFERSFALADEIDQTGIDASLVNGTLHLTLPKAESAKARRIPLKAAH
jgi:HSP20 family protein